MDTKVSSKDIQAQKMAMNLFIIHCAIKNIGISKMYGNLISYKQVVYK